MSPRRVVVALLAIVLGVLMSLGMWGANQPARSLSDDEYIAIALSQPQVFHPSGATSGSRVAATGVTHDGTNVLVDVVSDGQRYRVTIDSRSNQVTQIQKQ